MYANNSTSKRIRLGYVRTVPPDIYEEDIEWPMNSSILHGINLELYLQFFNLIERDYAPENRTQIDVVHVSEYGRCDRRGCTGIVGMVANGSLDGSLSSIAFTAMRVMHVDFSAYLRPFNIEFLHSVGGRNGSGDAGQFKISIDVSQSFYLMLILAYALTVITVIGQFMVKKCNLQQPKRPVSSQQKLQSMSLSLFIDRILEALWQSFRLSFGERIPDSRLISESLLVNLYLAFHTFTVQIFGSIMKADNMPHLPPKPFHSVAQLKGLLTNGDARLIAQKMSPITDFTTHDAEFEAIFAGQPYLIERDRRQILQLLCHDPNLFYVDKIFNPANAFFNLVTDMKEDCHLEVVRIGHIAKQRHFTSFIVNKNGSVLDGFLHYISHFPEHAFTRSARQRIRKSSALTAFHPNHHVGVSPVSFPALWPFFRRVLWTYFIAFGFLFTEVLTALFHTAHFIFLKGQRNIHF